MSRQIGFAGFEGLTFPCIIGIYPHERETPQDLFVDLKVGLDFSGLSDDIQLVVDYDWLKECVIQEAVQGKYRLLEVLALRVIERIFERERVLSVWIRLKKPHAIKEAQAALVEVERVREGEVGCAGL